MITEKEMEDDADQRKPYSEEEVAILTKVLKRLLSMPDAQINEILNVMGLGDSGFCGICQEAINIHFDIIRRTLDHTNEECKRKHLKELERNQKGMLI